MLKPIESKTLHDHSLATSYWLQRQRDPRVFCLVLSSLDVLHFIGSVGDTRIDQAINAFEIGLLVVAILMLALPYKIKRLEPCIRFGFMLSLMSLQIFIFDLARRKTAIDEQGWHINVNFMICFSIVGLFFHFYSFSHDQPGHLSFGVLYINFIYIDLIAAVYPLEEIFTLYVESIVFYLLLAQLMTVALIRSQASHNQYVEYLFEFIQNQSFLSLVLNTMESGIIIIDEFKSVTYANPKFLSAFSSFIQEQPRSSERKRKTRRCCGERQDSQLSSPQSIFSNSPDFICELYSRKQFKQFSNMNGQELPPEREVLSFDDLIAAKDAYDNQIFELVTPGMGEADKNEGLFETQENLLASQKTQYFQIRFTSLIFREHERLMIKLSDVSDSVHYDKSKERNELLSLINATISHELRNPLNSIIAENTAKEVLYERIAGVVEDLFSGASPTLDQLQTLKGSLATLKEGLLVQDSSAKLMSFLIHDFLDYAQIKSNTFRTRIAQFNIVETIKKVMSIQKKKAQEQKLQFESIFKNISQDADYQEVRSTPIYSPLVFGDEQRIMQALLNLQSNALKFTKRGSVLITAEILVVRGEKTLKISVIDTGVGIPLEDQPKLFKLFSFVQNTQQYNQSGIGLGLVISEQIVSKFGGIIEFKSVPAPEANHGSTFSFIIPLPASLEAEASQDLLGAPSPGQQELNSKRLDFSWRPSRLDSNSFQLSKQRAAEEEADSPLSPPDRTNIAASVHTMSPKKKLHLGRGDSLSSFRSEREVELCEAEGRTAIFYQDFDRFLSNKKNSHYLSGEALQKKKRRVLIVDDQSFNIAALKAILEFKLGVAPDLYDSAFNGLEAVAAVKDLYHEKGEAYALILMDCNMPFMDGYEATLAIRHFYLEEAGYSLEEQPIITAVTGHSESQYVKKCFEAGMNQVLGKPVDSMALAEACKQAGIGISA